MSNRPEGCNCTLICPETDNPCSYCSALDAYDPCPVIGFGCGWAIADPCDCCTAEQQYAARGMA